MSCLKKYKKVKYLGKGSYGAAILVELRSNPAQKFVIKEIVIGHLKLSEQNAAKMEAEVLHQMSHSNITMYVESFVENSKLYIVMEHADGGDLTGAISKRRKSGIRWPEDEVMRIFVQLCLALKHVHEANILHRDLKSQNVFLTSKGIVKLGDFGIAKVLDASEDQARTQIGTPYYLSPEICESKPYGRKSDVWSLGVILFELLTLEMPFQATSLPALVHRICTTEPPYEKVQMEGHGLLERYSDGMLTLLKSMLHKDPGQRPFLKQLVMVDIMRVHISKLLSYTMKVGNGGVGDIRSNGGDVIIDSEEADRNIERARVQERLTAKERYEQDARTKKANDREAHRIEEREKLKKFRIDMVKKKEIDGLGADDEVKVPPSLYEAGADTIVVSGAARLSHYHSPNYPPQRPPLYENVRQERDREIERERDRDRERDMERERCRNSPNHNNRYNAAERGVSVRERRDTFEREADMRKDRLKAEKMMAENSERRIRALSQPDDGRASHGIQGGHYRRGNNLSAPCSVVEANMRMAHVVQVAQNQAAIYQHMREERGSPDGYAKDRMDRMRGAVDIRSPGRNGQQLNPFGRGYKAESDAPSPGYRDMPEERKIGRGQGEYESAARREFFANKAAALAVKARIDSSDQRGRESGANFGAISVPVNQRLMNRSPVGAVSSREYGRELNDWDRNDRAVAMDMQEKDRERMMQLEREREIQAADDPVVRIALIKAQKEREREKVAAEQARQLQLAHEAQREERRKADERRREREKQEREERKEYGRGEDVKSVEPSAHLAFDIPPRRTVQRRASAKNSEENNVTEIDSKSQPGRQRKGWGPPAALPLSISTITKGSGGSSDSPQESPSSFGRGMSNDSSESPMDESKVLLRLEQRRDQHQKAREQARDVFRKLREQRLKQGTAGTLPLGSIVVVKKRTKGGGGSTDEGGGNDSDSSIGKQRNAMRQERLKDVIGHVARAVESVDQAVEKGVVLRNRRSVTEQKDDVIVEETREMVQEEEEHEDELTSTIDKWLNKCLGNVTARSERRLNREKVAAGRRRLGSPGDGGSPHEVEEEEGCEGKLNASITRHVPLRDDSNRSTDEVHDDEVTGLQYMLAKELMSLNVEDDTIEEKEP